VAGAGRVSLDPAYLEYPHRQLGMDHALYPWSNMHARPPVSWPDGKAVAVVPVVLLEWFPLQPGDKPFRAPGHMATPYPDYRHYTARDYGLRVGAWRLLEAFAARGIRASFATNAAVAERCPELVQTLVKAGHELVAHSTDMNGTFASGLPEEDERALIRAALNRLEAATGTRSRGWLSIAQSQSWNTPRLLAEAEIDWCGDWSNDELPYRMSTEGRALINLPLNHELSDRAILVTQGHGVESYAEQVRDAYAWLGGEAQGGGGRMLPLTLTPYIVGLPYRMGAFEALLDWLDARPGTWWARCSDVVGAWGAQA